MWFIIGSVPLPDFPLYIQGANEQSQLEKSSLELANGVRIPVGRGTAALAATTFTACNELGLRSPGLILAGDPGDGKGSATIYAWLEKHLENLTPTGLVFHYLFPDLDWHNRVLIAARSLPRVPLMVADAGFMYVAKMSGYAHLYDLFTPDIGEMAFLADEKAPHPFYTRGFLLAKDDDAPSLLRRSQAHGNCPMNLLIKGSTDYIVSQGQIVHTISEPSVAAMECIGGTGDLVTGLVTAFLMKGLDMEKACLAAARIARLLAEEYQPNPGTTAAELLSCLPQTLRKFNSEFSQDTQKNQE
jgi:hypothetical protein